MSDLTNREDVIATIKQHYRAHDNDLLEVITYEIENLPSAEPEIIRCKDCKYFKRNLYCVDGTYDGCEEWLDEGRESPVTEDDYCSEAERKEV